MNLTFMADSSLKIYPLRLQPSEDLRSSIEIFAREQNITAGFIITAIGSLSKYNIRFANKKEASSETGHFEILSLNGTISADGVHLHISIADGNGKSIGGHLLEGSSIYTTAEIIIGESSQHIFTRNIDSRTGFNELEIGNR